MLVALLLSVQTKDETNWWCMKNLKNYGLTVDKMVEIDDKKLESLIYKTNYKNKKVKFIKEAA